MKIFKAIYSAFYCLTQGISLKNIKSIKGKVVKSKNVQLNIGVGSKIYGLNISGKGSVIIGNNVEIRKLYVHLENNGKLIISNDCFLGMDVKITCSEAVNIGRASLISPNVVIIDNEHVIGTKEIKKSGLISAKVIIGDNCWVGASSIICKGAELGNNSVLGAMSLLNSKTGPDHIYFGIPAKFKREVCYD